MALRTRTVYNQYRGNQQITPPSITPISVDELVDHLKIGDTGEGVQLTLFIQAAVEACERYANIALITQVWTMTIDNWKIYNEDWWDGVRQGSMSELTSSGRAADILLPVYPLISVDTINANGSPLTIADYFITDTQQRKGRLTLKRGAALPLIEENNGVDITYTSGFGATAATVPADIRLALLQMSGHFYSHRGDKCSSEDAFRASGAKNVMDRYKVMDL